MTDSTRGEREQSPGDEFGLSEVRELLRLIKETDITEIQIKRGSTELHIKRGGSSQHQTPFVMTPSLAAGLGIVQGMSHVSAASAQQPVQTEGALGPHTSASEIEPDPGSHTVTSPMVGTFYSAPSPKDPPYVKEGDTVHIDDVVGIVEAMKIMNEIVFEGETTGRIARILVKNGQPVEYGQALMIVEPL
jgi:acetyl-CoA carboxylase biotin carboxyl carrier protein